MVANKQLDNFVSFELRPRDHANYNRKIDQRNPLFTKVLQNMRKDSYSIHHKLQHVN